MEIKDLEQYSGIYDFKDQLKRLIYERSARSFDAGDWARDALTSPEMVEQRQVYIRSQFIKAIGGLPSTEDSVHAEVVGTLNCDGFRIEKIVFDSRPDTKVSSNLYIPDDVDSPRGAVLFLCGHFEQAKHHVEYQTVCQYLVRAGLVVLAIDPIGQGERLSYYEPGIDDPVIRWGTTEHDHVGCQCLPIGDCLARYFVHDAMRAVDYLCTRPEVDPARIGVTGNSGGGLQTSMMMMCDPRIAAAAPATFIMNRRTYMYAGGAQDAEQIWPGFTAAGLDHEDLLLAMTPKPVLVLAVKYDFFPIEGTRETVARTRRFWEMYDKGDHLEYVEDTSTHKYTKHLARVAAEFFSKHLLGRTVSPSDESIRTVEPSLLWCTKSGQLQKEYQARTVHHENVDRVITREKERAARPHEDRRSLALDWLRERVFATRTKCELNPRLDMQKGLMDNLAVYNAIWWSQPGIFNHAYLFRDVRYEAERLPVTIAVWDGGTYGIREHIDWIRSTCDAGRTVMVLDVSGSGLLTPHTLNQRDPLEFYEILHKLTCDLYWLGDSLAALRTFDVLRAIDVLEELPDLDTSSIRLYGYGRHGMYALLASALDDRIGDFDWYKSIASIGDWVKSKYYNASDISSLIIPGMLHYFELADLRVWGRE